MTEGIIQKVVDRYYGRAHINVLEGIKKELIEEIQKEFSFGCEHCFGVCKQCIEVSVKLIGDSD